MKSFILAACLVFGTCVSSFACDNCRQPVRNTVKATVVTTGVVVRPVVRVTKGVLCTGKNLVGRVVFRSCR